MKKLRKLTYQKIENWNLSNKKDLIDRIEAELSFLEKEKKDELFYDLLTVHHVLCKNFDSFYSVNGSITDFYLSYFFGITSFNPLTYNIPIPTHISISISIPEGTKDDFVKELNRLFHQAIKAVSNSSEENVTDYHYIVFDKKDILEVYPPSCHQSTMPKRTIFTKKEVKKTHSVISLSEKRVLTLLKNLYRYHDIFIVFDSKHILQLRSFMKHSQQHHLTTFEMIMEDFNDFDFPTLIFSSEFFHFHYLSQLQKEFELTWFKYFYPRNYYEEVIQYMLNSMDLSIVKQYQNNVDQAIEDMEKMDRLTFLEEESLAFYYIYKDAKEFLPNMELMIEKDKVIPKFHNLTFVEVRVGNGMPTVLSKYILKKAFDFSNPENSLSLLAYDGSEDWYTSQIIATHLHQNPNEISLFLNPFSPRKFCINHYKHSNLNEKLILSSLETFRNTSVMIYNCMNFPIEDSLKHLLSIVEDGTQMIVIDSFKKFLTNTKASIYQVLSCLESLHREILIFDSPKNMFKTKKSIEDKEIKYLSLKQTYTNQIYKIFKDKDGITIEQINSDKKIVLQEGSDI